MSSGKGGGGGGSHDYFGSVVALLGWGPARQLNGLLADGKLVWEAEVPVQRESSANPFTFDVEGYGRCHFYWGTDDQTLNDPVTDVAERDHPAHRRRVFIVLEDFLFGRERTSAPDISVIWTREPDQEVIPAAGLDNDGQANPIEFALEVLTDDLNGIGLEAGLFHVESWSRVAAEHAGESGFEYLTPVLSDRITALSFLADLAGYSDLWFRATDEGQIEVGRWRDDEGAPPEIELTMADLIEGSTPLIEPGDVLDTTGSVFLEFVNPEKSYEDDHARFQNGARRGDFQRDKVADLQRPWIRRGEQAGRKAAEEGERLAQAGGTITLEVRETRAVGLVPGARFLFSRPDLEFSIIGRVISRVGDGDDGGAVSIEAEKERVFSPTIFVGGSAGFEKPDAQEIEDLAYWHPIQLPPALSGGDVYRMAFLAGRTQGLVIEGRPCLRAESLDEFQALGVQRTWAVPFQLTQAYPDTVAVDDETGTLIVDLEDGAFGAGELDAAPTPDEISDDKWLVFLIRSATPHEFEICTLRTIEPPVGGNNPLHVWRARFGTTPLSFQAGDHAYIIERSALTWFEWRGLQARAASATPTLEFKLVPATSKESLPAADATPKTLTLRDQSEEAAMFELEQQFDEVNATAWDLVGRVETLENAP